MNIIEIWGFSGIIGWQDKMGNTYPTLWVRSTTLKTKKKVFINVQICIFQTHLKSH